MEETAVPAIRNYGFYHKELQFPSIGTVGNCSCLSFSKLHLSVQEPSLYLEINENFNSLPE